MQGMIQPGKLTGTGNIWDRFRQSPSKGRAKFMEWLVSCVGRTKCTSFGFWRLGLEVYGFRCWFSSWLFFLVLGLGVRTEGIRSPAHLVIIFSS